MVVAGGHSVLGLGWYGAVEDAFSDDAVGAEWLTALVTLLDDMHILQLFEMFRGGYAHLLFG